MWSPFRDPREVDTSNRPVRVPSDGSSRRSSPQQLLSRLQSLAGELATASAPLAMLLTNSLNIYAARARQGDGQAKELLRQLFLALDDGRAAMSSIEVARGAIVRKT